MLPEGRYAELFLVQHRGRREVNLRFGRCDVLTKSNVVEVEPFDRWREGLRQSLAYAAMAQHQQKRATRPALAVYGTLSAAQGLRLFQRIDGIADLFLLRGDRWDGIGTEERASQASWVADDDLIEAAIADPGVKTDFVGVVVDYPPLTCFDDLMSAVRD